MSRTLRVIQYIARLRSEDGGPVRAVIDLSNALAARGHEVTVLTSDAADAPEPWKNAAPGEPRLEVLPPAAVLGLLPRPGVAQAETAIAGGDVLHLHGIWNPANLQLARAAQRRGRPYVISVRGMLDDWSMRRSRAKKRVFLAVGGSAWLHGAARVHLTAQAELDQACKYFPRARGRVIPNLLDLTPFEPTPDPSEARGRFEPLRRSEPTILFLSRLHPKKGVERLIDAAGILRDEGARAQVLLAGSGDEAYVASLRRRIEHAGLSDRVHLVGHVGGTLKASLYAAADLMCLPTSQENFGFVFFEALAAGTGVVTTRGVDTWPELLESGGAVILDDAPERLTRRLADELRELLADADRVRAMGEAGRAWMFAQRRPEQIAARFEGLYMEASGVEVPA